MKSYGEWLRDFGMDHNVSTPEEEADFEAVKNEPTILTTGEITIELPADEDGNEIYVVDLSEDVVIVKPKLEPADNPADRVSVQCSGCGCWFFPNYCYAEDEDHWCGGSPLCIP
jgi:hypothetical protein